MVTILISVHVLTTPCSPQQSQSKTRGQAVPCMGEGRGVNPLGGAMLWFPWVCEAVAAWLISRHMLPSWLCLIISDSLCFLPLLIFSYLHWHFHSVSCVFVHDFNLQASFVCSVSATSCTLLLCQSGLWLYKNISVVAWHKVYPKNSITEAALAEGDHLLFLSPMMHPQCHFTFCDWCRKMCWCIRQEPAFRSRGLFNFAWDVSCWPGKLEVFESRGRKNNPRDSIYSDSLAVCLLESGLCAGPKWSFCPAQEILVVSRQQEAWQHYTVIN